MSERSAAIGLASASSGLPPPNNSAAGLAMNDQVTASRKPSAASVRLASRVRFCSGVSIGGGTPSVRRGRGVVGTRSSPAMRTICSTMSAPALDVGAPARHGHFARARLEAEVRQDRQTLALGNVDADQPLHFAVGEVDDASRLIRVAGDDDARGLAAADVEHHARRELQAGHAELRIDAALETIARVGDDAELAAGLGDVDRVPQRALDQHVAGRGVAARMLAAHDAGDRFDAIVVGDDDHAVVERVSLAVERQHALAGASAAHAERAFDLGEIEDVQRPAAIEGEIIGDVDQRVDRPQADRAQPLLHPFRRRAVGDAAHQAQREGGAELRVLAGKIELCHRSGNRTIPRSAPAPASSVCRGPRRRDRGRCRKRRSRRAGWASARRR